MKLSAKLPILISLLISVSVFGQGRISDGRTSSLGRLDSISKPEEVEAIIGAVDKRYAQFRVNTTLDFEEDYCKSLGDITTFKALSKADFDKNGYTDLLVIGFLDKSPMILILMGSSGNRCKHTHPN